MKPKNLLNFIIGIVVLFILVVYMVSYQVRYDEVAVITTLDKAVEPAKDASGKIVRGNDGYATEPGSLREKPDLYFKYPWPIQKVYTYPKRLQLLEDQMEEQTTADGYSIVVRTYLTWRIEDPSAFFRSLRNIDIAQQSLQPLLRNLRGVISQYRFDQLVNTDPTKLALREIEEKSKKELNDRLAANNYGIQVVNLGIRRIVFPQSTTSKVFDRMKEERQRMAQNSRSSGTSQAVAIRSEADNARMTILSFANRQASVLRSQGETEATRYYELFQKDQEFAIFLRQIESLKLILAKNTTFVLDAEKLSPLDLFVHEPGETAPAK